MATTTDYSRLFEFSITLTLRAGYLKRVIDTATVYSRLFELPTTFDIQSTASTLGYLESRDGRLSTLVRDCIPLTFKALRRRKNFPDSSNHSLYLIKLFNSSSPEGHCGGNQLLDGSVCISLLSPSISNDLHVSIATLPGSLLTLPFSSCVHHHSSPDTLVLLKPLSYHESSKKKKQHSKWNCVGANRPQHMHMHCLIACG